MPFMFAHPAVVVPVWRRLGRYGGLSALVVGSITPDMHYFFPFEVSREESHSFLGLFWYCLPVGLLLYFLFHLFIKYPLVLLLPNSLGGRLAPFVQPQSLIPKVSLIVVIFSLFIGALSHITWDAFTHFGAPGVMLLPFLQSQIFSLDGYPFHWYQLLQLGSTFIGMGALLWWIIYWLRSAPIYKLDAPFIFSKLWRFVFFFGLLGLSLLIVMLSLSITLFEPTNFVLLKYALKSGILIALSNLGLGLIIYSLTWHLFAFRYR